MGTSSTIALKTVTVRITGTSPILMARFDVNGYGKKPPGLKNMTPRQIAELSLYQTDEWVDREGRKQKLPKPKIYWPGENVFAAIKEAGQFVKVGKRMVTSSKGSLVPACLEVVEKMIEITPDTWEVDSRRAVARAKSPGGGNSIVVHRPRFDAWQMTFTIAVTDDDILSLETIRELVDIAGTKIGMGPGRPSRGMWFGKFRVDSWDIGVEK